MQQTEKSVAFFSFCVLFIKRFLIRRGVSIFCERHFSNLKHAHGAGAVNAAVVAGHALDIAAIKFACGGGFHCAQAVL